MTGVFSVTARPLAAGATLALAALVVWPGGAAAQIPAGPPQTVVPQRIKAGLVPLPPPRVLLIQPGPVLTAPRPVASPTPIPIPSGGIVSPAANAGLIPLPPPRVPVVILPPPRLVPLHPAPGSLR